MKVFIEKDDRSLNLKHKSIVCKDLLEELKLNPSSVIVVKNDEVILEDELIESGDDVKILSVVSGG